MRVTSKGQVTIPKYIREQSGFMPGCEVSIVVEANQVIIKPKELLENGETRGEQCIRLLEEHLDRLREQGRTTGLSTDEIMEMTRGPYDDVNPA